MEKDNREDSKGQQRQRETRTECWMEKDNREDGKG